MEQPEYIVPLLSEIKNIQHNGFNVISTFAGGGGSSTGYRMAGYKILLANEFVEEAQKTYSCNKSSKTILNSSDLRKTTGYDFLEKVGLSPGQLDILDGSPPCASFSTAGSREKNWGKIKKYSDVSQRSDDLFFEFARVLSEIKPKVFVAENVSGLVKGAAKGYFIDILNKFKICGYNVEAKLLNAQWLGVPQSRQRLIFIGVRDDLGLRPVFPKPFKHYYTLKNALSAANSYIEPETNIKKYAIYKEWKKMGASGTKSKKYFQLVRPALNMPCPTVTATAGNPGAASVVHPLEPRKFSVSEIKSICSFPDDYDLTGNYSQSVERCGRAVPPVMMKSIAATIQTEILEKINGSS
jgi:DNA (cytosine-5)-methyltransferase 1